ncbi:MAG: YgiT-type zinc finger protein [Gammaproteobacteria bacterium]|nr:YgiT-type zinc finger protein [Gammaproteobacteria bacterium]
MIYNICPMCERGELTLKSTIDTYQHKGKFFSITVECAECPVCGSEITLPGQIENNESRIRDEKRKQDGLLSGAKRVKLDKEGGVSDVAIAPLAAP